MNKSELKDFLITARQQTYASGTGTKEPLLPGSVQYEFTESDWLYRDVYNIGNKIFAGLETVYYKNKPVWSMSYFGDFKQITEEEADKVLRQALIDKASSTRLGSKVKWHKDNYEYTCDGSGNIDELEGSETITKNGSQIYFFYYAGGFIG